MNLETKSKPSINGHRKENGAGHVEDTNNNLVSCVTSGSATIDPRDDGSDNASSERHETMSCSDKLLSWRCVMVFLLHSSFMVAAFARNCMPIALICMTQENPKTDISDEENQQSSNESLMNFTAMESVSVDERYSEFSWDSETKGLILSSVSFLSFLAPLIANFVQPYFGHKNTLTIMTFVCVVSLFLTPVGSRLNPWVLIALRTILGATFGANVPTIGDCVARWAPTTEKQTMVAFIFTGLQTGGMLCSLLSGYLCLIPFDNGWPFIFYVIGAVNLLWIVVWHVISSVNPEDNKFISVKELNYIKQHRVIKDTEHKKETEKPPYKIILSSIPVVALLIANSFHFWIVNTFFTYLPIYFSDVLAFSVTETGVLMTTLSLIRFISMGVFTMMINWMMAQNKWSVTAVKKFVITSGLSVSTASVLPIIFMGDEVRWAIVACFGVSMFFQSSAGTVLPAVPLDIAPRYAGFITGLAFSLGGLATVSGPLIIAALTPNNTREEWQLVWTVVACMFFTMTAVFFLLGDCRMQPWACDDRVDAPEVVSPFDPMRKRFSVALNSPPMLALDVSKTVQNVDKNHEIELVIRRTVSSPSTFFTTETSLAHPSDNGNESTRENPVSLADSDGVFNDGFEFELDRSLPELSSNNNNDTTKPENDDNFVDVRF